MSRNTRSGSCLLDGGQRLDAVARLADDFDVAELVELVAQLFSCELLVVDDKNFHGSGPAGVRSQLMR